MLVEIPAASSGTSIAGHSSSGDRHGRSSCCSYDLCVADGPVEVKGRPRFRSVAAQPLTSTGATGIWRSMNNTKTTTSRPFPKGKLHVIEVALEAAGIAIALVDHLPSKYPSIADQVIRSASSVPANLAEGRGRFGKDRQYHFRVAFGSAREIDVHLRLILAVASVDRQQTQKAIALFDRVRAMTWRLMHPRT
jgi:four helix bundle protein